MQSVALSSQRWKLTCAIFLIAFPILAFYLILWRTAVRVPILDDYEVILGLANSLSQTHGLFHRLILASTSQHNGYVVVFQNLIYLAEYTLLGQVRILPLVALGDAFALVVFCALVCMSRVAADDLATKWILLAPIAYLVFQLQYASALNFASSSLQHLAVVAFSLLSIWLLSKDSGAAFAGSCVFLVLAIEASPNGFFVVPIGLAMLAQSRRWLRIPILLALAGSLLAFYLFVYSLNGAHAGAEGGGGSLLAHLNLTYALSFLGSSAARFSSFTPSVVLGVLLCGVIAIAAKRRYFSQNPAVFYSMMFVLINAIAVSGLRSDLGIAQSLASRYRTYSNVMLVLCYIFMVESLLPAWKNRTVRVVAVAGAMLVSMAFCLLSDLAGARFLYAKKIALTHSYAVEWRHDGTPDALDSADLSANPALARQLQAGVYRVNLPILRESVRLGVYRPPQQP